MLCVPNFTCVFTLCLSIFMYNIYYCPQTKFVKVIFLHVSVCPQGGWYPSILCRWYPSIPCRSLGGLSKHAFQVSRCTSGGSLRVWLGGLQAHTHGEVEGSGLGGLQAHN